MDDDEVASSWSPNWWLRANMMSAANSVRGLLALQVHRNSKEIAAECTSQPPGVSRATQRQQKEDETRLLRTKAKADEQGGDLFLRKEKRARLQVVNVAILEKQNDMISKQLKLLTDNKDVFIRKYNEETYDDKVVALLEQMPNPVADLMKDAEDDDGTSSETNALDPYEED